MRRNRKVLIGAAAVGVLALVGTAASTNSIIFSNSNTIVAYGSENITGATVTSISYTLSTDGTTVNSVTFVAQGDTHGSSASVGFTTAGPVNTAMYPCGAGTYDGTTATTYICDVSALNQLVGTITGTDIVVGAAS